MPDELLFRQVRPGPDWFQDGKPTSQNFRPLRKDAGKLSVALESLTTAADAFLHHTGLGFDSVGTWGLSLAEVDSDGPRGAAGRSMEAFAEPTSDNPAHGFVDFRALPAGACRRVSLAYLVFADMRGCLHP